MEYRAKKVLVTGADGFIGSHMAEALVSKGARVTALAAYKLFNSHGWLDDPPPAIQSSMIRVRGDVRDPTFIRRIVAGQDIVFHLAALIAIPYSYVAAQSYVETNIIGTLNVLEAARESAVQRVVHTSTSEVYGTALTVPITESHPLQGQSPYSASKIGADMMAATYARSFGLRVTILRPFNTFGPRQSERAIIPTVIRQMVDPDCHCLKVGALTTVRDFTYVDDTVAAFLAIGRARSIVLGQPYNAGSGGAVTIAEMIDIVASIIGTSKPVRQENTRMRPDDSEVQLLQANAGRILADAGWHPKLSFKEGLVLTVNWWRQRLSEGKVRADIAFMA